MSTPVQLDPDQRRAITRGLGGEPELHDVVVVRGTLDEGARSILAENFDSKPGQFRHLYGWTAVEMVKDRG